MSQDFDQSAREKYLQSISQNGLSDDYSNPQVDFSYPAAGEDIANALITYWKANPTLSSFAKLLAGASSLKLSAENKRRLIFLMNSAYLSEKTTPIRSIPDACAELLFWDRCPMQEAKDHFKFVGNQLGALVCASPTVSSDLAPILQAKNPSEQMKQVANQLLLDLQTSLHAAMAKQSSVSGRFRLFLHAAAGVGGASIVDESTMDSMRKNITQAATAGCDQYIQLRSTLVDTINGPLLDRPRFSLERLQDLLHALDQSVNFGVDYDPNTMLSYWRQNSFQDIDDSLIVLLYQNYFSVQKKPTLSDIDVKIFESQNRTKLLSKLKELSKKDTAYFTQHRDDVSKRRVDGFEGRHTTKHGESMRNVKFVITALLIAVVLFLSLFFIRNDTIDKVRQPKPKQATSAPAEKTAKPTPKSSDDSNAVASEKPKETEKPAKTSKPKPSATATPKPTAEETPTPTSEPKPTQTAHPTSTPPLPEVEPDVQVEPQPKEQIVPEIPEATPTLEPIIS